MNEEHVIVSDNNNFYIIPYEREEDWYYYVNSQYIGYSIPQWAIPIENN